MVLIALCGVTLGLSLEVGFELVFVDVEARERAFGVCDEPEDCDGDFCEVAVGLALGWLLLDVARDGLLVPGAGRRDGRVGTGGADQGKRKLNLCLCSPISVKKVQQL